MTYAIRYQSPTHGGMLCEMDGRALDRLIETQAEADERREAYWETPEEMRLSQTLPPETFPYFERVSAYRAHEWVKADYPHETLLFIKDGKVRRA